MKGIVRYSEAFKLQVVRELEEGKHLSCLAVSQAYGIGGSVTVQNWINKYGKNHLIGKVVRVETVDERSELKKLKSRIGELEKTVCNAHMDLCLERSYVKLACKAAGIEDVDNFKKKHVGTQFMMQSKKTKS